MKFSTIAISAVLMTVALVGCKEPTNTADKKQAEVTRQMAAAANDAVGMPNITNWTEKRFAKLIYELKDSEVTTYSYFMDMHGKLHFLCESIGYGLNASVQYSNPMTTVDKSRSYGFVEQLPQPEPNGLFMPEGLAATFVLCADAAGGVRPVYSEPELIVSPFKLNASSDLTK